jgi:hypothetical protein
LVELFFISYLLVVVLRGNKDCQKGADSSASLRFAKHEERQSRNPKPKAKSKMANKLSVLRRCRNNSLRK